MSFEMEVGLIVLAVMLFVALLDIFCETYFARAIEQVLDVAEEACAYLDRRIDQFFDVLGW